MKSFLSIIGTIGLLTRTAFAHGGHGVSEGASLLHYLIEPAHGLFVLALIALLMWLPERRILARQIKK